MSRRDTILVAVLINVGLLTVLFATAVNREPQTMIEPLPLAEAQAIRSESVIQTAAALPPSRDEGDQALRTFREQRKQKMLNTPVVAAPKTTAPKPSAVPVLEEYADDGMVEVTVKRGDVLERIARANDTTVKAIQEANNLTSTMLRVGQVLRVPVGKKEEAKALPPRTISIK